MTKTLRNTVAATSVDQREAAMVMTFRQKADRLASAPPREEHPQAPAPTPVMDVGAHVCSILSPRMPHLFPANAAEQLPPRLAELLETLKRLDRAR